MDNHLHSIITATPEGVYEERHQNAYWYDDRAYRENEILGGYTAKTKAGISVTHDNAINYSPVWRAISMISGDISRLPLHLYRRFPNDTIERAKEHPHYKLFRRKPNGWETAYKFWRRRMVEVLLWGGAYVQLVRDGRGIIQEALPLCPDRTYTQDGGRTFITEIDGKLYTMDGYDVLYFEWLGLDGEAIDVVAAARETWAAGLAAVNFTSRFFGRGGRLGGILEMPSGLSQTAIAKVEEGFRRTYENSDAAFQTIVLRENAKFHAAQSSMVDAQMVEGRKESIRDVARFFGMAPSRLGEESASSYNSKAEDNRDYLDTTLAPFLVMITSELVDKTLTDAESWPKGNQPEHYWEHNTNDFLRMDAEARFRTYGVGIQYGIISPNEARRAENMNPRAGGDSYDNPNTTPGGTSNQPARAALVKIVTERVLKFTDGRFDRLERKAKDSKAFQAAVEQDASEELATSIASELAAVRVILGADLAGSVLAAYAEAVENRLVWILDHVPAAVLGSELVRIRREAVADLANKLDSLTGDNNDATA